jgi:hypothetical protein
LVTGKTPKFDKSFFARCPYTSYVLPKDRTPKFKKSRTRQIVFLPGCGILLKKEGKIFA